MAEGEWHKLVGCSLLCRGVYDKLLIRRAILMLLHVPRHAVGLIRIKADNNKWTGGQTAWNKRPLSTAYPLTSSHGFSSIQFWELVIVERDTVIQGPTNSLESYGKGWEK